MVPSRGSNKRTRVCAILFLHYTHYFIATVFAEHSPEKQCGTFQYEMCQRNITEVSKNDANDSCRKISVQIEDSSVSQKKELKAPEFNNAGNVLGVSTSKDKTCRMTLCDDEELMGHCAYFQLEGSTKEMSDFRNILQPGIVSASCTCNNNFTGEDRDQFDRNYVGVAYSPYDKYWESNSTNGKKIRVSWQDYSLDEIRSTLRQISTKFSYIATFGMGTARNTSAWDEGDKIAFVAPLAAELNSQVRSPVLRVSIGIFRKDDVNLEWKSKELLNAIDAAKVANSKFNGTVWGITVTSEYVTDAVKAKDAIEMIHLVKDINARENLRLKVGIRLGKCSEYIAVKRPEDDTGVPAYQQVTEDPFSPLTSFQSRLHEIAKISDFILCIQFPSPNYAQLTMPAILRIMQSQFLQLRQALQEINPKLKLIVETGVPSQGIGNGFVNTEENLREYWQSMADFAKKEKIMFHMFEAVDQPWKNVEDAEDRVDINGPNGTDAHYGWWRRQDNSQPPVYIEKFAKDGGRKKNWFQELPFLTKALILGFSGFVLITLVSIGYLWWKLRTARKEVISRAYIQQFHSGGDEGSSTDTNYAVALRIPYDQKYELPKDNFDIDKNAVIGSGQCGVVLRGTVKGTPVAFKCTTVNSTVVDIKAIMSEIKILSFIGHHENLVCILGAYTKKIQRGIVYIALEYCPLGSVETFLRKLGSKGCCRHSESSEREDGENTSLKYATVMTGNCDGDGDGCYLSAVNPAYVSTYFTEQGQSPSYITATAIPTSGYLTPSQLNSLDATPAPPVTNSSPQTPDALTFIRWAHQIASAMEFVSAKNVIHADLAARNILLASMDQAKVSDFGLSRKLYQEMGVIHDKDTPLPWRWMAPESLKHLAFSVESDVWSFGVTIWEIFSLAEVPYHGISYNMQFVGQLEKGMRLPQAKHASAQIHDQLLKCWDESPNKRPSFSQLKQFFHKLLSTPPTPGGT